MPFNEELRPFFTPMGDPTESHFAVEPQTLWGNPVIHANVNFEKCRETFSTYFTGNVETILMGVRDDHRRISKFLDRTEDILRFGGVDVTPSVCGSTVRPGIMYIQPSMFWRECYVKRSLLTIILRAGLHYNCGRSYEEALKRQEYVIPTIAATMRFLYGFTKYTGRIPEVQNSSTATQGWHHMLAGKTEEEVRRLLVKNEDFKPSPVGIGTLWS